MAIDHNALKYLDIHRPPATGHRPQATGHRPHTGHRPQATHRHRPQATGHMRRRP